MSESGNLGGWIEHLPPAVIPAFRESKGFAFSADKTGSSTGKEVGSWKMEVRKKEGFFPHNPTSDF